MKAQLYEEPESESVAAASTAPAGALPQRRAGELRRAAQSVRTIVARLLGGRPRRIVHRASGLSNLVFEVAHPDGEFVVRISPTPDKLATFAKERWAMTRARAVGVPVPEVLEVDDALAPQPYMVARKARGREASTHPDRTAIVREMGRCTAQIHSIGLRGFGRSFDGAHRRLACCTSWQQYLDEELRVPERLALFERHRLLGAGQCRRLREVLDAIGDLAGVHCALNHGDMRAKNVLVDERGAITAVLDWEDCCAAPAPVWDLAIALHDLSIDDKHTFLDGYGLSARRCAELATAIKALNVVNYAEQIALLVRSRNQRALQQYRLRLSGALDLYSL